jgi:hypothetical protein
VNLIEQTDTTLVLETDPDHFVREVLRLACLKVPGTNGEPATVPPGAAAAEIADYIERALKNPEPR